VALKFVEPKPLTLSTNQPDLCKSKLQSITILKKIKNNTDLLTCRILPSMTALTCQSEIHRELYVHTVTMYHTYYLNQFWLSSKTLQKHRCCITAIQVLYYSDTGVTWQWYSCCSTVIQLLHYSSTGVVLQRYSCYITAVQVLYYSDTAVTLQQYRCCITVIQVLHDSDTAVVVQ